jgi:EmrB/QacA subfamily drug resistance transporter
MTEEPTRRGATLAVLCAMALMIVLDGTIVAVAVPTIQRDLDFSAAGVAWVMNAYLVAFAGLLLLAGRLGDLFGAWRVFLAGLAVFTLASLLCGLAGSAELLVIGRFVQGAGGALGSAVILGMIVRLYPSRRGQARAMGIYSFVQASGAAVGFVVGGVLTQTVGWPWIFLVNVPVGVLVWIAAGRLLPREPGAGVLRGLDVPGALLVTAGLSAGVYAIVRSGEPTADAGVTWSLGAAAVVLIGGFLVRQRLARNPLVPLRLLARPWLLAANAAVILIFATGMGFQFLNALYVQRIMGYDALATGIAFVPTPVVIGLVSLFLAPRLTGRFGPRPVLMAGLAALAAGLILLSRAPADPSYLADMFPALIVMGLGVGVTIPAIIMLTMAGATRCETGMVSGLTNTAQQAGAALGLAVLAASAAAYTDARRSAGAAPMAALHDGYSLAFLVAAGFVVGAFALTAVALRHQPVTPAPGTEPALAEPALAEPALAEPALAEPALAEPALVDPGLADPGVADPGLTEPGLTEPGLTGAAAIAAGAERAAAATGVTGREVCGVAGGGTAPSR